jgi:hypothetical protein
MCCTTDSDSEDLVITEENVIVDGDDTTTNEGEHQRSVGTSLLTCTQHLVSGGEYTEEFETVSVFSGVSSITNTEVLEVASGSAMMVMGPEGIEITCGIVSFE